MMFIHISKMYFTIISDFVEMFNKFSSSNLNACKTEKKNPTVTLM